MIRDLFSFPGTVNRHFRGFRKYTGNHMLGLIVINLVMSYAEGIGIALFFPLLKQGGEQDSLSAGLGSVLRFLHIPATPTGALPFIVLAFVLKGLLLLAAFSYQGYLAAQIPQKLKNEMVRILRRIDYRAILGTNTGFLSNLLVNEAHKVSGAFVAFARTFPPALNVLLFLGIVCWLDWRLTAVLALMGLCVIAVIGVTGRIALQASQAVAREGGILASLLIQMVQAFKYLRATAGFGAFQEKIGESAKRYARADYRSNVAGALSQSVSQPLMVMFLGAIIYYRAGVEHQPLGSLFILLLYFFRVMTELWTLQFNWQSFVGYLGPVELLQSTLDRFEKEAESNGQKPYTGLETEIAVEELSFAYAPPKLVLSQINLRIAHNSTVAFVGESGSGKSTLADLLVGTLKPTTGRITVDGVSLAELDLESLRGRVGYVPQDAMLFDDTVANNISLWSPATEEQIRDAARRAKCLDFIDDMPKKLDSEIGDRGVKLSGGQRQRIAIARELFKRPDILVLDEATSALDTESERAIQESIDSLKGQMTILIIAHRLSTIRNCQHICVLDDGRIVEEGSYDELLARPGSRFQRFCQLQQLATEKAS
jgi:subfamily B ATP-binding cassette protein MsbA